MFELTVISFKPENEAELGSGLWQSRSQWTIRKPSPCLLLCGSTIPVLLAVLVSFSQKSLDNTSAPTATTLSPFTTQGVVVRGVCRPREPKGLLIYILPPVSHTPGKVDITDRLKGFKNHWIGIEVRTTWRLSEEKSPERTTHHRHLAQPCWPRCRAGSHLRSSSGSPSARKQAWVHTAPEVTTLSFYSWGFYRSSNKIKA